MLPVIVHDDGADMNVVSGRGCRRRPGGQGEGFAHELERSTSPDRSRDTLTETKLGSGPGYVVTDSTRSHQGHALSVEGSPGTESRAGHLLPSPLIGKLDISQKCSPRYYESSESAVVVGRESDGPRRDGRLGRWDRGKRKGGRLVGPSSRGGYCQLLELMKEARSRERAYLLNE